MKLHEIIKEKRLAKQYTQEQIAHKLGITTPAVNKWEKGTSFPDITLLPALARLLDTDLNTLLSFQDDLSDQEVALFLNELALVLDKKGFEHGYHIAMNKIKEFPNCHFLSLYSGFQLEAALAREKHMDKKSYEKAIESLYRHALESSNIEVRTQAQSILIKKHMERKEYDQIDILLQDMPTKTSVDKKHIQSLLLESKGDMEQASLLEEERLMNGVNEIQNTLITLMNLALKQDRIQDAEAIANIAKQSAQLFDLWEYTAYVAPCEFYTKQKKRIQCIQIYAKMLKAITVPWKINESPLYRHIKTKAQDKAFGKTMRASLISALREDEETIFLKQDKEFQSILDEYETTEKGA